MKYVIVGIPALSLMTGSVKAECTLDAYTVRSIEREVAIAHLAHPGNDLTVSGLMDTIDNAADMIIDRHLKVEKSPCEDAVATVLILLRGGK